MRVAPRRELFEFTTCYFNISAASLRSRSAIAQSCQATTGDPARRFVFDGLAGDLRYSASAPVRSELRWSGGQLYGLAFGAARLPMASADSSVSAM